MARFYPSGSGGGGVTSTDVTAERKHVLAGYNTITKDSNDEIVAGTIPNRGTGLKAIGLGINAQGLYYHISEGYYYESAVYNPWVYRTLAEVASVLGLTAAKLLSGQTVAGITGTATNDAYLDAAWLMVGYSGYDDGVKKVGTLLNNTSRTSNGNVPGVNTSFPNNPTRPALQMALCADTAGAMKIHMEVPKGAYGQGSFINRNAGELGWARPNELLAGARATSANGINFLGTLAVQSILSFSAAAYSSAAIEFRWQNPAKGAFSGVIIVGKTGSYPTSINDGTRYYKGHGNATTAHGQASAVVSGFIGGRTYYFRAFSYAVKNGAEWLHATTRTASATPTIAKGSQRFTASQDWTVPAGVGEVQVFCVGGGGGGREGENATNTSSPFAVGAGGSGGFTTTKRVTVTPGQSIYITVGAGGWGSPNTDDGWDNNWGGTKGGHSSFGSLVRADGGEGGGFNPDDVAPSYITGGSGGGGRYGHWYDSEDYHTQEVWGSGGSDGGNGISGWRPDVPGMIINNAGRGQGTTTREFGESTGALYSGGGGGGRPPSCGCNRGKGGDGGGSGTHNVDGAPNTGGGGAGGDSAYNDWWHDDYSSNGGTGIVIVRWGY